MAHIDNLTRRVGAQPTEKKPELPHAGHGVTTRFGVVVDSAGEVGAYSVDLLNLDGSTGDNLPCVFTFPPGVALSANDHVTLVYAAGSRIPYIDASGGSGSGEATVIYAITIPFGIISE